MPYEDYEDMGYYVPYNVMGDVLGDAYGRSGGAQMPNLKAAPKRPGGTYGLPSGSAPRPAGSLVRLPPRPIWRPQLAPGVPVPGEGLQPLPLTPSAGNGVFTAALQTITFTARPQVPFRAERLLASVRRTGAAGVLILAQTLFVGRDLQQVQQGAFDIEFFSATAFDTRLFLDPAEPGIEISMTCTANPAVAGADTVAVSILLLGRSIR